VSHLHLSLTSTYQIALRPLHFPNRRYFIHGSTFRLGLIPSFATAQRPLLTIDPLIYPFRLLASPALSRSEPYQRNRIPSHRHLHIPRFRFGNTFHHSQRRSFVRVISSLSTYHQTAKRTRTHIHTHI